MINRERVYEEYLVVAAQQGDAAAWDALVRLRGPRLFVHANRLLRDRDMAQDAVQEAWVEILRGLPGLRTPAAFPAWALRIVTRRCARAVKGLQRGRRLAEALTPLGQTETAAADPAHLDLRGAIEALPPGQSAAIALYYLEQMRLAEVAVALDIPLGTAKSRLNAARAALRTYLKGDDHDPDEQRL